MMMVMTVVEKYLDWPFVQVVLLYWTQNYVLTLILSPAASSRLGFPGTLVS